jgi:GT2 family glycosyltransferase
VTRHGGRYLALGRPCGINAARNVAVGAARGPLLCLLDDDVAVWDGWLGALLAAVAACPEHEAFGGPIRARLEGRALRACGREALAVPTTLELGGADRDVLLLWGANLAFRRSAYARIGAFDERLAGAGDEEDWLRRLHAAGGRARYVARAGVDHRRAGADARLRVLARAAWARGAAARRYDEHRRVAPSPAAEARVLAGCLWHAGRRRCANGLLLAALSAGRLRQAVRRPWPPAGLRQAAGWRPRPAAGAGGPDFLSGASGTLNRRTALTGAVKDAAAALVAPRGLAGGEPRRVAVLLFARPEHAALADAAAARLRSSRHDVALTRIVPRAGEGKWQAVNRVLGPAPPAADWLVICDDDIVLPRRFLDRFLALAERHGLVLAQPAHAFRSHAAWPVTRRRPAAAARRTRFVEIGPVTAVAARAFGVLLPFPDLRMGWGLDAHWSAVAAEHDWPIGIVDATPIRHLMPVAAGYRRDAAIAEAQAFLAGRPYVRREQATTLEVYRR